MNDPNASAEKMQDMIDELTAAEKALVDITELKAAVAEYADKDQVNYTTDSWKPVEDARVLMQKAQDPSQKVTEDEIDEVLKGLDKVKLVEVSELKQLVAEADKAEKEDYEEAAWKTLQELLKSIKEETLVSGTEDDVQSAVQDLKAALADVKDDEPEDPDKPDPLPPEEIPGGNTGNTGSGNAGGNSGGGSGSDADKAVKTGDASNVMPYMAGMILAGVAASVIVRRKRS